MTAQKLTDNTYTNMFYKIKSNIRISVVALILNLISAPVILINMIIYLKAQEKYNAAYMLYTQGLLAENALPPYPDSPEIYIAVGVCATAAAVLIGIVIAMGNFSYLYKKSNVDMVMSLPLTTRQRFTSDFLSGAISYLAPFLMSGIVSMIISFIGSVVVKDWSEFSGQVNGFSSINDLVFKLIIGGFFIMLMVYALAVFTMSCCGSFFEAIAYTLGLNLLIPGIIGAGGYLLLGNLYGINFENSILPLLTKTSPIGGIIGIFYYLLDYNGDSSFSFYTGWLIPFIIVTLIYAASSWFLYKNRKAEDVSKPFVYKLFYYIVITCITFTISSIFIFDRSSGNIVPLIIFSAIVYLILEVITNRGFKKVWLSAIRYAITMICVLIVISIMDFTDGFGMVYQIPKASQVSSIEIDYPGIFESYESSTVKLKEKDAISNVISMHSDVLDLYKEEKKAENDVDTPRTNGYLKKSHFSDYRTTFVKIKYNLKSGAQLTREYNVRSDLLKNLSDIELSDEYIDQRMDNLRGQIIKMISIENYSEISYYNFNEQRKNIDFKNMAEAEEMLSALSTDMKSISEKEFYTPSKPFMGFMGLSNINIPINENYPNVIKVLEKHDINVYLSNKYDPIATKIISITKNNTDEISFIARFNKGSENFYSEIISQEYPEIEELLKVIQPNYMGQISYTMNINGTDYAIPEDYSSIAESLYNKAKQYNEEHAEGVSLNSYGYIVTEDNDVYYFNGFEEYNYLLDDTDITSKKYKVVIQK